MKTTAVNKLITLCSVLIAATFVLLPFHAVLTVWAGSNFGHYDLFRLWIEFILLLLAPMVVIAVRKDSTLRNAWRRDALVWVSVVYIGWQIILGLWALHYGWVNHTALLDGWATDLRFVGFFLLVWAVATQQQWLAARWRELLLIPAAVATVFGLLQAFVLPNDILRHVGYGPQTIMPFETVDQKATYVRIQSTLRGPNPLGAYLALTMTALVTLIAGKLRTAQRAGLVFCIVTTSVVLGLTYSRSAYIGTVLAIAVACWLLLKSERARILLLAASVLLVLVLSSAFLALRHNSQFENTFFHTDQHSHASSSNQVRRSALVEGARDVLREPFGRGAGSAGPASAHNNHPARIAENYYLQIGQESGWLGLGLFMAMNVLVAIRLWQRRTHQLAVLLLGSFVGISVINMLSHAWADDTLGMLWWGLAGIALSLPLARTKTAKPKRGRT
jgi:hypothetical protein